ncbi:hypothetical protein AKJ61_03830, partial [candidate division MSBL1 archaeon SCGC-AAA259B11]
APYVNSDQDVTVKLTVSDGDGHSDSDTTTVTVEDEIPYADADGPYTVDEGHTKALDGTGSYDPDGDGLTYEWTIEDDPTGDASLSDADTATPTFDAPASIESDKDVTVELTVWDKDTSHPENEARSDTTTVTVNNLGSGEGADMSVGSGFHLNSYYEPDDDWEYKSKELSITNNGDVKGTVTISDQGTTDSCDEDQINLNFDVEDTTLTISPGETKNVTISIDPNGPWVNNSCLSSDIADYEKHQVKVTGDGVQDGGVTKKISAYAKKNSSNEAPTADFSLDSSSVDEGGTTVADNSSTDPDGDSLTLDWSVSDGPGEIKNLTGDKDRVTYYAPDDVGSDTTATIKLTVSDGHGHSNSHTEDVTVNDTDTGSGSFSISESFDEMSFGVGNPNNIDKWYSENKKVKVTAPSGYNKTVDLSINTPDDVRVEMSKDSLDFSGSDTEKTFWVHVKELDQEITGELISDGSWADIDIVTKKEFERFAHIQFDWEESGTLELDGGDKKDTISINFRLGQYSSSGTLTAVIKTDSSTVDEDGVLEMRGEDSSDPEGQDLDYTWEVISGPGKISPGENHQKNCYYWAPNGDEISENKEATIKLTVTDPDGNSDSATKSITVLNDKAPTAEIVYDDYYVDEGENHIISATNSSDPETSESKLNYYWSVEDYKGEIKDIKRQQSFAGGR